MISPPLIDRPPVRVRHTRHGPLMFFPSDKYVGRSLDLYGEFSDGETEMFRQLLRPGQVALDIGANIGAHTIFMSRAVGRNGIVMAIEPQRVPFQMLCGNVAMNGLINVLTRNMAVGSAASQLRVPVFDFAADGNFGGVGLGQWETGELVPVTPLDQLNLRACHFIKMDVEGMEVEALQGAAATIARHRPLLYVENDREARSAELIGLLQGWSYRLWWHLTPLYSPANFFNQAENVFGNIISINMIGVPAERPVEVFALDPVAGPEQRWRDSRRFRDAARVILRTPPAGSDSAPRSGSP